MRKSIFIQDKFIILNLIVGLFLNLVTWILLLIFIKPGSYSIPLHYNIYFGVDKVGAAWKAYLLAGYALAIYVVNLIIAWKLSSKAKFLSYLILGIAVAVQLLMIVSISSLIYLNN